MERNKRTLLLMFADVLSAFLAWSIALGVYNGRNPDIEQLIGHRFVNAELLDDDALDLFFNRIRHSKILQLLFRENRRILTAPGRLFKSGECS